MPGSLGQISLSIVPTVRHGQVGSHAGVSVARDRCDLSVVSACATDIKTGFGEDLLSTTTPHLTYQVSSSHEFRHVDETLTRPEHAMTCTI